MIDVPTDMLLWALLGALLPVFTMTIASLLGRWSLHREKQKMQKMGQQAQADATSAMDADAGSTREAKRSCSCQASVNGGKDEGAGKKILIAYATQSNTACTLAHKLFSTLNTVLHEASCEEAQQGSVCCRGGRYVPEVKVLQLAEEGRQCSVDHLLESHAYSFVVLIASTYTNGTAPGSSQAFADLLQDAYTDFRVPRDALAKTRFAIFGLGDVAYGAKHFNRFAKNLYTWCNGLGASFVVPPVYASEANTVSLFNVFTASLVKWVSRVVFTADGVVVMRKPQRAKGTRSPTGDDAASLVRAAPDSEDEEEEEAGNESRGGGKMLNNSRSNTNESAGDVEDVVTDDDDGGTEGEASMTSASDPQELLYPRLRQNLQRQGYHLVGSHSGVKLCRWTKAMLRGRGGCYKHTFYNIASHQCMEMTPSLACANKCVFCWRHHTNPVSRSFRWKVDPPQQLVAGGIEGHQKMIKQMRGVPGVTPERLEDAMQVRHCALSLVGEPIMYPEINAFVDLLHERGISSFMVTNAQFPEQLRMLKPVTQLYLSIDAPTPEELKRIDRPLFEDYWERCLACIRELRRKPQRTVFRLTLVNQYNTENVAAYAHLVRLGWPDFIEVKGVTYCGTSATSTLTMKENVPRHEEVVRFCADLCAALAADTAPKDKRTWLGQEPEPATARAKFNSNENKTSDNSKENNTNENTTEEGGAAAAASSGPYCIACEHEHSCCVLIALRRFLVQGVWHTWIDYDKFTALARSGRTDFTAAEYAAPTPSWAVFRSNEKGFDPTQLRVHRKSGKPVVVTSGC
ncbi:hypothetical protein TraAM80_04502 [Trypanosoma rangeli]|uniref:tRNA 4-demethylwyosine synthase (AdoMet-dependent) n=1 Tax=Trypanosoma rangeli TaxID=5698 RepID=A0A3S5IRA8_TRYRA|nr:uncharacterized protein TraAM80_04502 [Trypanosoma rangeli]RNF05563.1 hypothetical protein TraAM80_04502 [Trypanosoma rangeli]|eukprot:RNF05563.1 hypothetical protein TraAM80_04502 [Trypanosoma rangeli]